VKVNAAVLKEMFAKALIAESSFKRKEFRCTWSADPVYAGHVFELAGKPGSGKTELMIRFFSENPGLKVAWIEEEFSFYPYFWEQSGLDLKKVCFLESGTHWSWCARQALNSGIFDCLVLGGGTRDALELRRLQLLAEKSKCPVFLLSNEPTQAGAWPIQMQFSVQRMFDGSLSVRKLSLKKHSLG